MILYGKSVFGEINFTWLNTLGEVNITLGISDGMKVQITQYFEWQSIFFFLKSSVGNLQN